MPNADADNAADGPRVDSPDPIERGRALLRAGQLDEAKAAFQEALTLNPVSAEANEGVATVAYLKKDLDIAATHFEAAAKADPRRAEPLINLGAVQNRLKQYPQAMKTLQKALARDRRNVNAYFNLAIACRGHNQTTMAINAYREAIRLKSDFAEAHQNLGLLYLEAGNTRQAIASLNRALEISPSLNRAKKGLEKANATQNQTLGNRFGALVDAPEEMSSITSPRIALSESARTDDRETLRELAGRLERSLAAMLEEVRTSTEPVCHKACRNMTENTTRAEHAKCEAAIRETIEKSDWLLSLVDEHVSALQKHEGKIESLMRGREA